MKIRNPLATQTQEQKQKLYKKDCIKGVLAYSSNETAVPLSTQLIDDVEFIGGLWRVQDPCEYQINRIRDKDMIMGPRISHNEKTHFEYYKVGLLTYNCYGPLEPNLAFVAAKYVTDKCVYWSYGKSIAEARAFLGVRLYDDYKDLIHKEACKNILKNKSK